MLNLGNQEFVRKLMQDAKDSGKNFVQLLDDYTAKTGEVLSGNSRDILRKRWTRFAKSSHVPFTEEEEEPAQDITEVHHSDGSVDYDIKRPRIHSKEEFIKVYGINLETHDITKWIIKRYEVYSKIDKVNSLSSISATVKPKAVTIADSVKDTIEFIKNYTPQSSLSNLVVSKDFVTETVLEIPLCDLHIGKFAKACVTGSDYTIEHAIDIAKTAVQTVINKAGGNFSKILLVLGNDFFHVDNIAGTTTSGTKVESVAGPVTEIFTAGIQLMIDLVALCTNHATCVDVLMVPGNHDTNATYFAGKVLEAYYKDSGVVSIIMDNAEMKTYWFGLCLLGFTHGHNEKLQNLAMNLAHTAPEAWAKTKYREIHTGHFHHLKTLSFSEKEQEWKGVRLRHLPSLSATDEWHSIHGFINSIRSLQAFLWDSQKGLSAIVMYND